MKTTAEIRKALVRLRAWMSDSADREENRANKFYADGMDTSANDAKARESTYGRCIFRLDKVIEEIRDE